MADDAQLLRGYVETRDEAAFAELVQRHLGMVYHAAVRQLGGEAHLAGDVTQGVFLLLAEKARGLVGHASLAGWLHATTRFKVAEALRAERRRRARETAARELEEIMSDASEAADWERLRPVIDEVLLELNASDREAVLLRFFEQRPFAEIAVRLQSSEGAAHKRVERALEKLRERLARRGVTSTAAALSAVLGANLAQAAPAGLAASVTGAVAGSGLPAVVASGIVSFMSTKTVVTAAAVVVVLAGGIATQEVKAKWAVEADIAALVRENEDWAGKLRAERERSKRAATAATNSAITAKPKEISAATRAVGAGGLASVEESRAFLRENPEVREAFANFLRRSLEYRYRDLIARLGLDDERKARFIDILARARRQIVGEHQFTVADQDFQPGEMRQQLREVLGDAGYREYQAFDDQSLQRGVDYQLTQALYATPTPLTPAQSEEVQRIVTRVMNDPELGPKYAGQSWMVLPSERWEAIIKDAGRVLAEPQVEALRELEQQTRFHRAMSEVGRAERKERESGKARK